MPLGKYSEYLDKVKVQVRALKTNSNVNVYEELKNFKYHLHYRIAQKEYNDKVVAAKINFEDFQTNHVEDALREFDRAVKEKEEEFK